jgi:acetylglutamate kinase
MDKLFVIKIGGNIIDNDEALADFLEQFAGLEGRKILVHGGGKLATRMAERLDIPQTMIEGRRVTDEETLRIITMVYAGLVNKSIVAGLQANRCNAIGLTGADASCIVSHKRKGVTADYGLVGDIDAVNPDLFSGLLDQGLFPVLAPLTHDGKGQLLNTNADTMAQAIATAMAMTHEVSLAFTFEKAGVLADISDERSVISRISRKYYDELRSQEKIFAGMIPKLDNAFHAIESGVKRVIIGNASGLVQLIEGKAGTTITHA